MDLKEWGQGQWILYLTDAATRFKMSTIINNKKPSIVMEKVILM